MMEMSWCINTAAAVITHTAGSLYNSSIDSIFNYFNSRYIPIATRATASRPILSGYSVRWLLSSYILCRDVFKSTYQKFLIVFGICSKTIFLVDYHLLPPHNHDSPCSSSSFETILNSKNKTCILAVLSSYSDFYYLCESTRDERFSYHCLPKNERTFELCCLPYDRTGIVQKKNVRELYLKYETMYFDIFDNDTVFLFHSSLIQP